MKISKFKIVNFRNHSTTEIDLKPVNVFIGPNASGKTSIVDALSFLLTGTTVRISKSGQGMAEMITFGESRALVAAYIDGIGKVTRTIPHTFQIGEWEGTMTEQIQRMYDTLGVTKESLYCSVYSTDFLDMTPTDQKNFIFSLMGVVFNDANVKAEFDIWCKANSIEDIESHFEYLQNYSLATFNGSSEVLDNVYDDIVKYRKNLKRNIKELEVKKVDYKSSLPDGITVEHKDTVIAQLTKLRIERDEILRQLGQVKSASNTRRILMDTIKKEETLVIPKETKKEIDDQLRITINKMDANAKVKMSAEVNVGNCKDHLKSLNNFNGKCPLSSKITCNLKKEDIDDLKYKITKEMEDAKATIKILSETIDQQYEEGKRLKGLYEQRTKADIMLPEIEAAKKELVKLPSGSEDEYNALSTKLNELDQRMTKGQTILSLIEAESYALTMNVKAKQDYDLKCAELKTVDVLAEAFGPKGIKSIILNRVLKPVESTINEKLSIMTGGKYSVNFRIDEQNFSIYVVSDGIERRIEHLSSSEKFRIGIIMQYAINSLTNTRFLVIDNVDILDLKNRTFFWNFIRNIRPEYDTIVMCVTGTEKKMTSTDDIGVYLLSKRSNENAF